MFQWDISGKLQSCKNQLTPVGLVGAVQEEMGVYTRFCAWHIIVPIHVICVVCG